METILTIDPDRLGRAGTEIFVRAQDLHGQWGSFDIAHLDEVSLLGWLQGLEPVGVINTVGVLLGHGYLVTTAGPIVNNDPVAAPPLVDGEVATPED